MILGDYNPKSGLGPTSDFIILTSQKFSFIICIIKKRLVHIVNIVLYSLYIYYEKSMTVCFIIVRNKTYKVHVTGRV